MNAFYHLPSEALTTHLQNSHTPDNFSPSLEGSYRGSPGPGPVQQTKVAWEPKTEPPPTPQQVYMDDVCNDFNNQQIVSTNNTLIKVCGGCGEKITDRFLLYALDRYWHNSCLKCHCCNALLADVGSSCFTRRGLILCKKDYSSMFGCSGVCTGCGEIIPPSEMVAKATPGYSNNSSLDMQKSPNQIINCIFHLKCFTCTKCGCNLRPGDRFTMLGASLVCEQDWQKILKSSTTNGNLPVRKGKVGRPRRAKE